MHEPNPIRGDHIQFGIVGDLCDPTLLHIPLDLASIDVVSLAGGFVDRIAEYRPQLVTFNG